MLPEAVETAEMAAGAVEGVDAEPVAEVTTTVDGIVDLEETPEYVLEDVTEEEEGETGEAGDKKPAKKSKKTEKKRELVFDESLGQVIARKKRKPGRGGWEEFTDY
jgi:hypothetical protein